MIKDIVWIYYYASLILITFMSIYGIAIRPNLLKKIIMLSILSDTANMLAVLLGYHTLSPKPPVYPGGTFSTTQFPSQRQLSTFAQYAVDPIPQVLVVTAIVIGLAVLVFLSFVAVLIYRRYGTLDMRVVSKKARQEVK